MQNHLTWAANTITQDCIVLLVMIRDLTHNMKETKQGTMALVKCHSDMCTTVQGPNESIEIFFQNLHGAKGYRQRAWRRSGRHKQLHRLARQKIMDDLGFDEAYMENPNNLATEDEVEEEARAKSSEQFLA